MQENNKPYIFVIGNEKGGAGKTTCSMHLIIGLLDQGYKVASLDTDSRQHSLTTYLNNRKAYNQKNTVKQVQMPLHFHLAESTYVTLEERERDDVARFEEALAKAKEHADYIVIDTPGSHSFLSKLAHSHADTIVTPINDSFLDLDVMAKVNDSLNIVCPSIYSQMIWEQKMQRAARDRGTIEWIVLRNRLSSLDAVNKRKVGEVLEQLAKRISFKVAPGFSERVIFRELFLQGLTLLDLTKINYEKTFSISHVAARQELRDFLSYLKIKPNKVEDMPLSS
jgi:chromosome partitioning protein